MRRAGGRGAGWVRTNAAEVLFFMGKRAIHKQKVLILAGPTGSGKSDLSLQLAERLDAEIISADSVQVFKRLDIGSNKVPPSTRERVPHHMIDIMDHRSDFTAGDFYRLAREATERILARNKVPIVAGGTGFYLRWFVNGEGSAPRSTADSKTKVDAILSTDASWEKSIARLRAVDPISADSIPANDFYRLRRALEIFELSGKPPSFFRIHALPLDELDYDFRCIYIDRPDHVQFKREIDERCEQMVEKGLLEEVIELMADGLKPDSTAGRAIGYRQAIMYLQHKDRGKDQAFLQMLEDFMSSSRQYCRRQRTWFKREPSFLWLTTGPTHSSSLVSSVLEHFDRDYDSYKALHPSLQQSQATFQEELGDNFQKRSREYAPVLRRFDDFLVRKRAIERTERCWSLHFPSTT